MMKRLLFGIVGVLMAAVAVGQIRNTDGTLNTLQCSVDGEIPQLTGGVWSCQAISGGGAPTDATYITQTTNGSLTAEQALGALATGILKSTTTTGVLSIAVAGDFPTLNQNTTGMAANVTGTVAIANGGTGETSAAAAFGALKQAATTTATGVVELATDGESAANLVPQANDARLSNARTPTAHASTHLDNGSDPVAVFTSTRTGSVPASGGGTTNFLRADGTFAVPPGGSGPTTLRTASDQTSTSTSFANVGGLTASVNTTTTYSFRCNLLWTSNATTEGGNFSINGPSTSFLRWWRVVYTSATAHTSETQTAFDAGTLLTAGPGAAFWPVEIYGTFTTSASGTFAIRWRAETGGANSMTIKQGGFCQVY